jgi:transcription elongation GreA/GreB family factor
MIGKCAGDEVLVKTPGGLRTLEIADISKPE